MLTTEAPSALHTDLDQYAVDDLVAVLLADQEGALAAALAASASIAKAVEAAVPRLRARGRLIHVGAGTSGRLGVLDSVELFPTFSWPRSRTVTLLAGGRRAMFESVEGAEDHREHGCADMRAIAPVPDDVVILIAASGDTPYVLGALEVARSAGALTIGITNNRDTPLARGAQLAITLDTGSELVSGSTRLKAGTAQKMALNALSTAIMVRLDKVYGNLMVDLQATNAKLHRRAVRLTMQATGADEETARATLAACECRVKVAIVALLKEIDVAQARSRLAAAGDSVRRALSD
jgi:N-acetylmuramic acid 6-phosphate etherase